jgi:hypothetical protein
MADQRGLARADVARDDDEALALQQPEIQVGERFGACRCRRRSGGPD